MRQTILSGIVAASLVVSTVQIAPLSPSAFAAEGATAEAAAEAATAEGDGNEGNEGASSSDSPEGEPTGALGSMDYDAENDPMHLDPEKNPVKKVSSSDMFLEWTDDMEEGDGKEFVQSWAENSSVPDTANPVELWKQEAQGSAMMSSGFFTGDFAQSSAGSSRSTSALIPTLIGMLVIGQLIELIMRGIRMAQQ